jgi:hypothetical protein
VDLQVWLVVTLVALALLVLIVVLAIKLTVASARWFSSVFRPRRISTSSENEQSRQAGRGDSVQTTIAERVRFWEQQDQINQELIPRVIRQNEILTQHIRGHQNLPEIAARAVREALDEAKEEQLGHYQATLAAARSDLLRDFQSSLATADDRLSASIDLKIQDLSRQYRQTLHLLIGATIVSGLVSVAALILAVVL